MKISAKCVNISKHDVVCAFKVMVELIGRYERNGRHLYEAHIQLIIELSETFRELAYGTLRTMRDHCRPMRCFCRSAKLNNRSNMIISRLICPTNMSDANIETP